MRRLIAIFVVVVGLMLYKYAQLPKLTVKAPTTRYHGYELNRLAIHKAKQLTVLVSAEGFGERARGTGILLDRTHVLTCYHVASIRNEELWVYVYPGQQVYRAKPVYGESRYDLAVLELDRPVDFDPRPVFQPMHYDGEPITIIGNIYGSMKWFVGYGIVSGGDGIFLYTDGTQAHGDSGGPWVNEQGEIVALVDWGLEDADGHDTGVHGGVSAETIERFLKEWKSPSILQILLGGN